VLEAHLVDDLVSRSGGIQTWNVRRSVEEAISIVRIIDGSGIEGEWLAVGHPTSDPRLEFPPKIAADGEITRTRAPTQPLHRSAGREIHTQLPHVHWYSARRLIDVSNHH